MLIIMLPFSLILSNINTKIFLYFFFFRNVLFPTISSGTHSTDITSFSTDYKSDLDMDMHKPMNSLDTDYRPDYDGNYISLIIFVFIISKVYLFLCLGLSANNATEIPLPSFNTPITYDELRARNRQEYDRTLPNKPTYRY